MGNIVWLSSYPKSGNTWFRLFIKALLYNDDVTDNPFDLSGLYGATMRSLIDFYSGVETSDLNHPEIDIIRPDVYKNMSDCLNELCFVKTHELYQVNADNKPIYSQESTRAAIYFIRNPLDIAGSYAHHFSVSIDEAIDRMSNEQLHYYSESDGLWPQIPHQVGSWSNHAASWLDQNELNVRVVKYEDMLGDTLSIFSELVGFCGLDYSQEEIEKALATCYFDRLREHEKEQPFLEKFPKTESFFRKGKAGNWQEELTADQVDQIISSHKSMMIKCGYLTREGRVIEH